jgi:hypothetical protein
VSSDQIATHGGPPVAREILVPALVGIITSIVTDAIGGAPTIVQLLVAAVLGLAVWWLLARRTPGRQRRTVRLALLIAAGVVLVGVGVVAGLAVEWRDDSLVIAAWLFALVGVLLGLSRAPRPLSVAALPLAAAGIAGALGLTVFEAAVVARFRWFPPQPPAAAVARQLTTPDRLNYRIRAIGDFPLTETADDRLKVHVRWAARPVSTGTQIVTTDVGVRIGAVVAQVDGSQPHRIRLNAQTTTIPAQGLRVGGVTVRRAGATTQLTTGQLRVALTTDDGVVNRVDLTFPAGYRGALRGLLGDFDGDPGNDLRLRDGTILRYGADPASVQRLIDGEFATSWRLRPGQGQLR